MSELRINNVRLDTLLSLKQGTVIDAVPISERNNYRYWRGLHLGKIALNLMRERFRINAGDDGIVHFTDDHDVAYGYASAETRLRDEYSTVTQWNDSDCIAFEQITGQPAPEHFAGAVIAYIHNGHMPRSTHGAKDGYAMDYMVSFANIDPHSREALEGLFEINLVPQVQSKVVSPARLVLNSPPANNTLPPLHF